MIKLIKNKFKEFLKIFQINKILEDMKIQFAFMGYLLKYKKILKNKNKQELNTLCTILIYYSYLN